MNRDRKSGLTKLDEMKHVVFAYIFYLIISYLSELIPLTILSQLPSVQTVREGHLQVGSAVRTAAHREEDGDPAGRRCRVQDQPLIERLREGKAWLVQSLLVKADSSGLFSAK